MELTTLTKQELLRIRTAQRVLDGALSVAAAAAVLHLCTRQVKRLTRRLRLHGAAAFASPRRRAAPNNAIEPAVRERVLALARSDYDGFGPTLLAEKLAEREQIVVNRETLRQWLIAQKLHRPRQRRQKPRPLRERRARRGELIQADGSPHHWFEDRGAPCTLLLCIDDATSAISGGLFAEHETTNDYFELFERAFTEHGLPVAMYVDKHGIFRINHAGAATDEETHVQRALRELGVELICASSPQAKGRVERANRTLQDRLVKEFRLAGINTIAQANAALPALIAEHNRRFAVQPREAEDAHRPSSGIPLATILTKRYERVLSASLTFQISDRIYAIDPSPTHRLHKGMRVSIGVTRAHQPFVVHGQQQIASRFVGLRQRTAHIVDSKRINAQLDPRMPSPKKTHTPPSNHPWRAAARAGLALKRGHL